MRLCKFIICLAFLLLAIAGCKRFANPFEGERVVARAGRETLRQMDVEKALPAGVTGSDSLAWVTDYVNRWVRDQLKLIRADELFKDGFEADEELLESYRKILINRRLEHYFVTSAAGDSLYSDKDLRDWYSTHTGDYVLDRTIVKGRVVAVPTEWRQRAALRALFSDFMGDKRQEARAIAEKNGFVMREFDEWTEYPAFLALLPTRRNQSYDDLVSKSGVQEMADGGVTYYFVVSEARAAGQTAPYELVSDIVRQTVSTRRRAEIIKAAEDSLFTKAIADKKAIINL